MAGASDDLAVARERFLDQLHVSEFNPAGHEDFMAYWNNIAMLAQKTEDLAQLDTWNRALLRDKDRIAELRQRQQQAASSQMGASAVVQLLSRLLALLDDAGERLRKRLHFLRNEIGMWVFLAGPGKKSKPKPKKKGDETDDTVSEAILAQQAKKKKDTTKKHSR